MRYLNKLHLYVSVLAGVLHGCASSELITASNDTVVNCRVNSEIITRDGRQGIQMTNTCKRCLAVAFSYEDAAFSSESQSACYVPSLTRVVFWQATSYKILTEKYCDQAEREGIAGIATAEQLQENYSNGTCKIFGEFAD